LKSKDILDMFNVEKVSLLMPNLMIVLGTGTLVNLMSSTNEVSLISWILPLILLGVPLLIYVFLKMKELRFTKVLATQKSILIMVFPSNLGLLKKLLSIKENKGLKNNKFGVEEIYFLVTKNMPIKKEDKDAIEKFLEAYGIKITERRVDALENPKKLQYEVEKILDEIQNKENCAINVQTGTKASSIILYEIANKNGVDVHYLSSLYDKENNPIAGSENLYTLQSEYVDKKKTS